MIVTYRYRVKNRLGELNRQARAVNLVWNHANECQRKAVAWGRKWLSGYDLQKLCAGSSKDIGLLASTIDRVCLKYAESRQQQRRPYLRWRGKKSLGWVPIKADYFRHEGNGTFKQGGILFRVFYSRQIPEGATICDGSSFAQDARGNWFLNVVLELPQAAPRATTRAVGIDLGLKDLATLSTGEKVANPRHYAQDEARLASAQRAGKKRLARNIHAAIQNRRKDALHKLSARIVRDFDFIAVGGVTGFTGKAVLDASWSGFRQMLSYKAIGHGARYAEVDEAFTTQTCSDCGLIGGPKGLEGLRIREWRCECGAVHDRDVNAALNILRLGSQALAEGAVA